MLSLSRIDQFWRSTANNLRQQRMQKSPLREVVEDSFPLRLLVLALVILGILATDVAAGTTFSFWAVPISIVGTIWSYYRRRYPNIPVKFCIAIGMLVALGAFFSQLLGELNDTRLTLAGLLIQLQVLHSFDTPRRKDLGYSIVIGLILIGVAATLSETMIFAPVLLVFLALALPTLILDYRSRLGLASLSKPKNLSKNLANFDFRFLFLNLLLIVSLGLAIFAALPRFPGYKLQTFPVSAPINLKGKFTGGQIINPGYTRKGNDPKSATSQGGSSGPGKIDDNFYYGFNSDMNQNLRGEMVSKVVMRVRSQAAGFWRVLTFDRYTGQGWKISHDADTSVFKQEPLSYKISLPTPLILGKTQEIIQTYTIVSDLPNLIPALAYPKEIYFPAPLISMDKENGLRSPIELSENMAYSVVSEVPYRNQKLLNTSGEKYPRSIVQNYLQIPPKIADKIRLRTEEILANYNRETISRSPEKKTLNSPYEKALYLAQYLKQNYPLPQKASDIPYLNENEDLVTNFLFKQHSGYPDHFSTVLTVMLRSIGIPARLVVGFAPGQFNPFTGLYIVRNTDAYAMTEVYFPHYGWFAFDPIPTHPLIPPSIEETETFSVLHQFWNWVAGWLPSPVTSLFGHLFGTLFEWFAIAIAWFFNLFSQGWLGILTGLIISTSAAFGGWLSWTQWRKWLNRLWLRKLPPMESLYRQILQWTAQRGLRKDPAQTPLEYAQISYQKYPPATARVIDDICQAYVSWRYGGNQPHWQELQRRWQLAKRHNK